MSEINIGGVFLSGALVTAVIAAIVMLLLARLLRTVGFYRWVAHRPLVDIALFTICWACIAATFSKL
jgi:Protein of unknown function (DUF1656)